MDHHDLLHLISDCISDGIQCDKSCCQDLNLKAKILCYVVANKLSNEPQQVIEEMIYVAFSEESDDQKEEENNPAEKIQIMNISKENLLVSEQSDLDQKFKKSKPEKSITDSDIEKCKNNLKGLLSYKQNELVQQCSNMECCANDMYPSEVDEKYNGPLDMDCEFRCKDLVQNCLPLQRIQIVLQLYQCMIKRNNSATNAMFDLLEQCGYTHQQLFDDFSHVKIIHIDADNNAYQRGCGYYNIGMYLCKYFQNAFPCDIEKCQAFVRRHRDRGAKSVNPYAYYANEEEEDAAFQQECDKIHSYFFQFGVSVHYLHNLHCFYTNSSTVRYGTNISMRSLHEEKAESQDSYFSEDANTKSTGLLSVASPHGGKADIVSHLTLAHTVRSVSSISFPEVQHMDPAVIEQEIDKMADHHELLHLLNDCISDGIKCDKPCCQDSNLTAKILCHVVTNKLSNEPRRVIKEMINVAFSDDQKEEKADDDKQMMNKSNNNKSKWLVPEKIKNNLKELLLPKPNELVQQCSDMECCANDMLKSKKYTGPSDVDCEYIRNNLLKNCAPLQRIQIVLELYQCMIKRNSSATNAMFDLLEQCGYTHQQLFDDFSHVKIIHIDADNKSYQGGGGYYNIGMYLCKYFQEEFPCDIEKCRVFRRHHRDRGAKSVNPYANDEEEEVAFQQECDKIHSYFFQFGVYAHYLHNLH